MRKILPLLLVIISGFLLSGCTTTKPATTGNQAAPTSFPPTSAPVEIADRPFISLTPTSDGHWVTLDIKNISAKATTLEYDLIYFADSAGSRIEMGVSTGVKPIALAKATTYTKKILFGSESCTNGCKYRFDENVTEGTLTLKINTPQGLQKYDTAFRIQRGAEAKEGLTTGDGSFKFVSSSMLNKVYLTMVTSGLPTADATVKPLSKVYGIFPSEGAKGVVSIAAPTSTGSVYYFDGKAWQKLATTFDAGFQTAATTKASVFLLGE